jgi:hypothetical protein
MTSGLGAGPRGDFCAVRFTGFARFAVFERAGRFADAFLLRLLRAVFLAVFATIDLSLERSPPDRTVAIFRKIESSVPAQSSRPSAKRECRDP